ncbi:hypothetical protein [Streptomyces griseus]|uniref:hypothetical protein n=1 Tax=Streptomyces griseus TaxID=1911 RepID=UPI00083FDE81|nr:hypothetical protein [Streptomyces griseus]
MGIESDQLVYDYLSRVGDLAQQQQLSSGARMRLVSTLRGEIDRQRGADGSDSPAVVRRILGRLGTPDQLVAAAAGSGEGTAPLPRPRTGTGADAAEPRTVPRARLAALRKNVSRKGASPGAGPSPDAEAPDATRPEVPEAPEAPDAARPGARETHPEEPDADPAAPDTEPLPGWPSASAPHMAGLSGDETEWWQAEPEPFGGPGALDTAVPGFVGGLSPELLRPPGPPRPVEEDAAEPAEEAGPAEESAPPPRRRRPRLRLRRRTPAGAVTEGAAGPRVAHPLLLLSAALLVAGAVLGSWLALAGGWLLAYSSRRFSRAEAKWVAMGLPGVVVAGALVWLWGRMDGRWGDPIAKDALGDAIAGTWPVVVRTAAVASALYLVWRSRRLGR